MKAIIVAILVAGFAYAAQAEGQMTCGDVLRMETQAKLTLEIERQRRRCDIPGVRGRRPNDEACEAIKPKPHESRLHRNAAVRQAKQFRVEFAPYIRHCRAMQREGK